MAALPTGETMNSEGKTATQTAVNTNSNGQLSTAGAGECFPHETICFP